MRRSSSTSSIVCWRYCFKQFVPTGVLKRSAEFKRLDDKIDSVRGELKAEIHHLDDKLTTALEIRERLAALEAKVASR